MSSQACDVAVVGCGPVGSALATLLGRRGHHVVVFERHPQPYVLPRAVHFDHEVARVLQSCGLGAELPSISEPGTEYEAVLYLTDPDGGVPDAVWMRSPRQFVFDHGQLGGRFSRKAATPL